MAGIAVVCPYTLCTNMTDNMHVTRNCFIVPLFGFEMTTIASMFQLVAEVIDEIHVWLLGVELRVLLDSVISVNCNIITTSGIASVK